MLHVLAQYDVEVAWSGDQDVVEAFPAQGVGAGNPVTSRHLHVLVQKAAEPVSS